MFLGGRGFNILIHKYFSEEWEQTCQFRLKSNTTEDNSAAIYFPSILNDSILQSIFVISSFSWLIELIFIHVESIFHVVLYLTWKWFQFTIFFYLTIINWWVSIIISNNLKGIKDQIYDYMVICKIFLQWKVTKKDMNITTTFL